MERYVNAIVELLKEEKGIDAHQERKIRERLKKATMDELARTYEALYRFGVQEVFDGVEGRMAV